MSSHRNSHHHLVASLRANRGSGTPLWRGGGTPRRRGAGTPRRRGAGTPLYVPYKSTYIRNRGGGFLSGVLGKAGKVVRLNG